MASGSRACRSSYVNTPINPARELDELANAQGPARRSNAGSNKSPTEALTPSEAFTSALVPPTSKDLFTKFIKVIMEMIQAWDQLEPWKCPLKARTPETYSGKSHMDCYHFCQQCENYLKASVATRINYTPFATTFFRDDISLR